MRDLGPSETWRLAPSVHAVAAVEDLVLLDTAADAYFCLPGAAPALGLQPGQASVTIHDRAVADELSSAGLIVESCDGARVSRRIPPPLPLVGAVPLVSGRVRWRDAAEAIACTLDVLRAYRGQPFGAILRRAGAPTSEALDEDPSGALLDVTERFLRWAPYAPVSGKCFLRSFMLLRHLRRRGHDAKWVFAVSTWPFMAHCWLQRGQVVLDDAPERLIGFHPIMVV